MSTRRTVMRGAKLYALVIMSVILYSSCQSPPHRDTGDPAQFRERAAAKRAHAVGLREDMAELRVTIANDQEERERLRPRLDSINSEIAELNRSVSELQREMEGLNSYEAYIKRITLQRWHNRLDTARNRQYALTGEIIALENRIRQRQDVLEEQRYNAEELTKRAAKLDEMADYLEALGPAPEEDFWAQW